MPRRLVQARAFRPTFRGALGIDPTEQTSLFEALGTGDAPVPEVPTEQIAYQRRWKARGSIAAAPSA